MDTTTYPWIIDTSNPPGKIIDVQGIKKGVTNWIEYIKNGAVNMLIRELTIFSNGDLPIYLKLEIIKSFQVKEKPRVEWFTDYELYLKIIEN